MKIYGAIHQYFLCMDVMADCTFFKFLLVSLRRFPIFKVYNKILKNLLVINRINQIEQFLK